MRWILTAITALFVHRRIFTPSCGISYEKDNAVRTFLYCRVTQLACSLVSFSCVFFVYVSLHMLSRFARCEALGLLVPLDFDIAAFTSAAYQRGSLPRPSMEISSWSRLRA